MAPRLALACALAGVLVVSAAAAPAPLRVSLAGSPPLEILEGGTWSATVVVRRAGAPVRGARVTLVARDGALVRSARARDLGRGRYRGQIVFPREGSWVVSARVAGRTFSLTSVAVRSRELLLSSPTSLVLDRDGSLLLVEPGRSRILRADMATGRTRIVARGLPPTYGLDLAPDGSLVIAGDQRVSRVDPASGRLDTIATVPPSYAVGPVAVAQNGDAYVGTNANTVIRVAAGTGAVSVVATGIVAPHGIGMDGTSVLISDTGNDRVVTLDTATGETRTVATGVDDPGGIVAGPGGEFYVTEFPTRSLLRYQAGARTTAASGLSGPIDVERAADGTLYVVNTTGTVTRVRDGAVTRVRLLVPEASR